MKNLLSYIYMPIHAFSFLLILIVFHPLQWLSLKLGGYFWHKKIVDCLNLCIVKNLLLFGIRCQFVNEQTIPENRPIIIVSNHQSLYDISIISWYLRKYHVKFVAKMELKKRIPSISFNLRHGGSILIDRKNPRQAIPVLKELGKYIDKHRYAACIFPEGTRSRDGRPGKFNMHGLKTLIKNAPSALILPITINNAWKLKSNGWFPVPFGRTPSCVVHAPIDPVNKDIEDVLVETERLIKVRIESFQTL